MVMERREEEMDEKIMVEGENGRGRKKIEREIWGGG